MVSLVALGVCLVVAAPADTPAANAPPTESRPNFTAAPTRTSNDELEALLRRARNEYAYGDYEAAIATLNSLLYPMRLRTDQQVMQAREILAFCHYLTRNRAAAQEEFGKLLYLDPDYELDPYVVAPPIVELFEQTKAQKKVELDALRQRAADEAVERSHKAGYVRIIEREVIERADLGTLLPFGVGQFQNGDVGWGVFFALTELVLVAVNVASYVWGKSIGDYEAGDLAKRRLSQGLLVAQYASISLFGLTWSIGVVHARLNFVPYDVKPERVREEPVSAPTVGFSLRF